MTRKELEEGIRRNTLSKQRMTILGLAPRTLTQVRKNIYSHRANKRNYSNELADKIELKKDEVLFIGFDTQMVLTKNKATKWLYS